MHMLPTIHFVIEPSPQDGLKNLSFTHKAHTAPHTWNARLLFTCCRMMGLCTFEFACKHTDTNN